MRESSCWFYHFSYIQFHLLEASLDWSKWNHGLVSFIDTLLDWSISVFKFQLTILLNIKVDSFIQMYVLLPNSMANSICSDPIRIVSLRFICLSCVCFVVDRKIKDINRYTREREREKFSTISFHFVHSSERASKQGNERTNWKCTYRDICLLRLPPEGDQWDSQETRESIMSAERENYRSFSSLLYIFYTWI